MTGLKIPVRRSHTRLDSFQHYLTAFIILLKAIVKMDQGSHYLGYVILFLTAAALIALAAAFHHALSRRIWHLNAILYLIESIVIAAIAQYSFQNGKILMGSLFAVAAVLYLIAILVAVQSSLHSWLMFTSTGLQVKYSLFKQKYIAWPDLADFTLHHRHLVLTPAPPAKPLRLDVAPGVDEQALRRALTALAAPSLPGSV